MSTFKSAMMSSNTLRKNDIVSALSFYVNVCNSICEMDEAVLYANFNSVTENLLDCEKTISLDVLSYLADNMSIICSMLVLDYKGFRDTLADLIEVEIALDDLPMPERIERRKLFEPNDLPATLSMKLGENHFGEDEMIAIIHIMANSFHKYEDTLLSRTINNYVEHYSNDEKIIVGMLLSNIVYIVRGCNHNRAFLPTIGMMVNDAKQFFKI